VGNLSDSATLRRPRLVEGHTLNLSIEIEVNLSWS